MSIGEVSIGVLLFLAAGVGLFCSVGLLIMPGVLNKLHYLAPVALVSTAAITAAILINSGLSQNGIKALIVLVLLVISNPVLTQATAQAARDRKERIHRKESGRSDE